MVIIQPTISCTSGPCKLDVEEKNSKEAKAVVRIKPISEQVDKHTAEGLHSKN